MHDCIVNCDLLEIPTGDEDNPQGTLKAIVWDNGERYNTTGGTAESWLYVEDANGNMQTVSIGQYTKQPDVVIANAIDDFDGALPDYIVGVVYMEEQLISVPNNMYKYGQCSLKTYGVYNVGTLSFSVSLISTVALNVNQSYMVHGTEDANPHIDMWTDANNLVNGLPSLREFAVTWTESYSLTNCLTPPAVSPYTGAPARLYYTYGDINTPWNAPSNTMSSGFPTNGMNDVACFYDVDALDQYVVITYGGAIPCTSRYGLYATEMTKTATSIPSGTLLDARSPAITRVEAMSQYSPGANLKWLVVASMPAGSPTPFPWEVLGYDDQSNTYLLSGNYVGVDVKSPAVSGGVSSLLNGNIGNLQFNTGYYPRDYNNPGLYDHIWSTGVDAVTIPSMTAELQVDNNSVNYDWDVNRIYAVSTSSNSGFNILSAYYDGGDILYKESPNSFVYKPGTTGVQQVSNPNAITLYPNPANDKLFITRATQGSYEISNVTGRIVGTGKNQSTGIDIASLPPGLYIVKIKQENKGVTSLKFLKK